MLAQQLRTARNFSLFCKVYFAPWPLTVINTCVLITFPLGANHVHIRTYPDYTCIHTLTQKSLAIAKNFARNLRELFTHHTVHVFCCCLFGSCVLFFSIVVTVRKYICQFIRCVLKCLRLIVMLFAQFARTGDAQHFFRCRSTAEHPKRRSKRERLSVRRSFFYSRDIL